MFIGHTLDLGQDTAQRDGCIHYFHQDFNKARTRYVSTRVNTVIIINSMHLHQKRRPAMCFKQQRALLTQRQWAMT